MSETAEAWCQGFGEGLLIRLMGVIRTGTTAKGV